MSTPNTTPPLHTNEWNFDSIPDDQLIVCCYWEYARESSFLREFKSRCVEANRNPKPLREAFEFCGKDARRVFSIGAVANSFLLGFGFDPAVPAARPDPVTGLFPAPWQSLAPAERNYRARLAAGLIHPALPPFRRASGAAGVNALFFLASSVFSSLPPLPAHLYRQIIQDGIDHLNSYADPQNRLCQETPEPTGPAVPGLHRLGTHGLPAEEIALVQIQWGSFTDEQIVDSFRAWLKANRPGAVQALPAPGHKLKDWRANLTRLAVMRLLTHFSALDLIDPELNKFPAIWKTKQFSGKTWFDVVKWHDARREARCLFHQLFPFLPPADDPISWPTAHTRPLPIPL